MRCQRAKALVARQDAFEQRLDQNIARLDDQLATLTRETKAAESAIAQALKLLQAQVMSKAARAELQHGLSRAVEAATDAQERSRAVASNLVAIASEVDSRAPLKALARLETSMQSQLAASASGASSGPILHAKRITAQPESALMPTHCLSCQQPPPTHPTTRRRTRLPTPQPDSARRQAGQRLLAGEPRRAASAVGRQTRPPMQEATLVPLPAPSPSPKAVPHDGLLRRTADLMRNPKLTYGVPPANETRKQTQLQLHMLAANRRRAASGLDGGGGGGGGEEQAAAGEAFHSQGGAFGRVEAVVEAAVEAHVRCCAAAWAEQERARGSARVGERWEFRSRLAARTDALRCEPREAPPIRGHHDKSTTSTPTG